MTTPLTVARNRAARLDAPVEATTVAWSTTTGVPTTHAAPSVRDRRNAQACLDEIQALMAPVYAHIIEAGGCCIECVAGPVLAARVDTLWRVVEDHEAACRLAGVPSGLTR